MEDIAKLNINGRPAEAFEADAGMLAHITTPDSYADRIMDAQLDYEEACENYYNTDPNTEDIMEAAALVETAAKALISRALVIFHLPGVSREEKEAAVALLQRMSADSNLREQTCSQFYRREKQVNADDKARIRRLYKEKVKRMNFLDRCMRTESTYTKRLMKDCSPVKTEIEIETVLSEKTDRERTFVNDGGRICPPRIFPHDPIPDGEPVPLAPEVYRRFKEMQPEELVFDKEHRHFVLPPNYVSEDGRIDSNSIVWDYKRGKVTMKFVGEKPVTWDFKQYLDPRDVPDPNEWSTQYHRRLFLQEAADEIRHCLMVDSG